jgi:hypothetical protein
MKKRLKKYKNEPGSLEDELSKLKDLNEEEAREV